MRQALILALAVAVAVATPGSDFESVGETIFRPGYEYVYRYESQVLSGIRTIGNQVGGIKIHSLVKVQFTRGEGVMLKMQQINIFKVNDVVRGLHNIDIVPDSEFTRLTGEHEQVMLEHLVKPINFRYEDGEIRDVKTASGDKYWSINIKKGLVSLFQLKLTGKSAPWSDTDSTYGEYSSSSGTQRSIRNKLFESFNPFGTRRSMTSRLENAFKVMEMDVNGECETKYVVSSDSSEYMASSASQFVVTKVKNFENCLAKNSYEQGLFAHMPHFQSERKLIQPAFEAEYVLTGDRHHFLIKKATVEAKYFFRPYGPEGGQMSTHIHQKLILDSTREMQSPISLENTVMEKHGLKMEIPSASWLPVNAVDGDYSEERDWKGVVDSKLEKFISAIYPEMLETAPAELFQLQLIVRHIPRRQLISIIKSYIQHGSEEINKKGEVLLDILPTTINPETGKVLLDLIRDGTIRGIRARLSIQAMALTVKPTPEIAKYLMSLYREASSLERWTPHLRQTVLLAVGTLSNKMINHMRKVNKPIPELSSYIEEVSQEFIGLLSEASTETDKLRVLKAMGNMGAKELITPLKTVIEDRSLSKFLRVEAVIALKKLAKPYDKQVHPILLSVIMDKKESDRVRIAGIRVLKHSIPTYTTLQLLSHSLRTEQSTQVKTFIYTTLISLSNLRSPVPEIKQIMKDARKILKTMRAISIGILDSKDIVASAYSENLDLGATWNLQNIKSEKSGLSHSLFNTLHATIFGKRLKVAKFGVEGEMVTSVLRRLIGPYGLLKNIFKGKASVYDLLKPLSMPEMNYQWRDFLSRKNFRSVDEDEIEGLVFGELFGYEMFYRKFDKENMESWMNTAATKVPEIISKLREGYNFNTLKTFSIVCNSLVLPTPIGIPLSLNMSANAIFKLDGVVKATSMPSYGDFIRNRPFMMKKFEIETLVRPSWTTELFGYMGVDLKWMRTGVAVKANVVANLPVKGALIVDPAESKLVARFEPFNENVKTFAAKVEPVTFFWYVPKNINSLPFRCELKPIHTPDSIADLKYETEYPCQITGMNWQIKTQYTKCIHTWCPYYPLTGKQAISINYRPISSNIREIVVKIKKFSQDWYSEYEGENIGTMSRGFAGNYRTTDRYATTTDESYEDFESRFDTVETDGAISSPRKAEVYVEVSLTGYRSNKVFQGKATWLTASNYLEHQFNLQVVAVPSPDMNQFKLKIDSAFRLPAYIAYGFYGSDYAYESKSTIGRIDIYWGTSGFSEKNIKCKIHELDESSWSQVIRSEGFEHSHYLENAGFKPKAFRYAFEAVFPQMTPVFSSYLTKFHNFFKYSMYNYLKTAIPEHIPQNKLIVYGQYITKLEMLSFVVKTPRETDLLLDIPVHCPFSKFYRPYLHDLNPGFVYKNFTGYTDIDRFDEPTFDSYNSYKDYTPSLEGICKIYNDKLMSFDGTPIMLPLYERETGGSRCDVLLARDCSDRSTFTVTGSFKYNKWAVKVTAPSYHIELIPDVSGDRYLVKVNNEEVDVRYDNPVTLYETPQEPSSEMMATITKTSERVKVTLYELGVTVSLERSNKIQVKVSPASILQGRLCGLCGNNNYDISDDMRSFEGKLVGSHHFVMDNVMPSDSCDARDYETQLRYRHEGYSKMKKTVMVEKMIDGQDMTCFSKNPVTKCRSHCTSTSVSPRNVRFVCFPNDSSTANEFANKYESGYTDLTEELARFDTSLDSEVDVPDNCVC